MRAPALWLQIPLGLGMAASVQVGNALGAGDVQTAKRSSSISLLCTGQAARAKEPSPRLQSKSRERSQSPACVPCLCPLFSLQLPPSSTSQLSWEQHFAVFQGGFV